MTNMRIPLIGWLIFFTGIITLLITVGVSFFTGNVSMESLNTLSIGENFRLLFGQLMIPLIIGIVLMAGGAITFVVSIVVNIMRNLRSF